MSASVAGATGAVWTALDWKTVCVAAEGVGELEIGQGAEDGRRFLIELAAEQGSRFGTRAEPLALIHDLDVIEENVPAIQRSREEVQHCDESRNEGPDGRGSADHGCDRSASAEECVGLAQKCHRMEGEWGLGWRTSGSVWHRGRVAAPNAESSGER